MRKGFVLVGTDLGSEDGLQSELKKAEGVAGVYQVYGAYISEGIKGRRVAYTVRAKKEGEERETSDTSRIT